MKRIISLSIVCVLVALFALPVLFTENKAPDTATDNVEMNNDPADTNESPVLTTDEVVSGGLRMATIFADGMVLQRNEPVNVFGYANVGSTVTVTLGEQTGTAIADSNGEWKLDLPAMAATKGLTLTVTCGSEALTFNNVDVGEVLVVSGQSNAQYRVIELEDWDEISNLCDTYQNIRIFAESSLWEMYPSELGHGTWIKATKSNLEKTGPVKGNVSAIGYVAAMKVAAELGSDVTVALINVCRSATHITAWLPAEELYADGYEEIHAADIASYENYKAFWDANGRWPKNEGESTYWQENNPYSFIPTLSYNSMIAPIKGYTASAVIWYQGESDEDAPDVYSDKFTQLQSVYSEAFANEDIPFFIVQIAPYNTTVKNVAYFEAIQYDLTMEHPNVYVVSTGVDGSPLHNQDALYGTAPQVIHPSRKSPLGYRIGDRILLEIYEIDNGHTVTAPQLKGIAKVGDTVVLTFDTDLRLFRGIAPEDFEVLDGESWVKVTATMSGKTVTLDVSDLTNPTQVRYGFGGRYIELSTGELLRLDVGKKLTMSADGKHFVYTDSNGQVYEFYSEDGQIVRTIKSGNVTNASGEPLPTFWVTIPQ